MAVEQWVKDLSARSGFATKLAVGEFAKHPKHGMVQIVSGTFWGEHGLSNFWYWRKVNKDGSLSKQKFHGYGWM